MRTTFLILLSLLVACSASKDPSSFDDTTPGSSTSASGAGGGGGAGDLAIVVGIEIQPADPVIEIVDGNAPLLQFQAIGSMSDGTSQALAGGTWKFDRTDIALIDAAGMFLPTGQIAGKGGVTYERQGTTATTTATVKLRFTSDPQSIPAPIKDAFGAAVLPDAQMEIVYPYDATVFPRGLTGPTIQWNGGGPADWYRIEVTSPLVTFEGWSTVPPKSHYDLPKAPVDVWRAITESTVGEVGLAVQRWSNGTAFLAETQTWKVAAANLAGIVYFWEINGAATSDIVRMKPGDPQPELFLQPGPGMTCVACHSVSKDGKRITASYNGFSSPWATFDAATGQLEYDAKAASGFQAISPDGKYVLWRHWNDCCPLGSDGHLLLSEYNSTVQLADLTVPSPGYPGHPAWSGDGKKIAFSMREESDGLSFTNSELWITDVDLVSLSFASTKKIVPKHPEWTVATFPTFSPDSKWLAFSHAKSAYSRNAEGRIGLVSADGAIEQQLEALNGIGVLDDEQSKSTYEPTFLPVSVGGYFWIIVQSERKYGNTLEDTVKSSRSKQLWVAAIDIDPVAGQDPSHPAFWLPGQRIDRSNMRGAWALDPCKPKGETCESGFDCCEGFCTNGICDKPGDCAKTGDKCTTAADCCDPEAICTGTCDQIPPPR